MIQFSMEELRQRIHACWIGKSIGGTLGTPYEGKTEMNNISGFASPPGEPLPNDDLDLQLVWLRAVNERGIEAINSKLLGEYWLSWITPHWNEYGVAKANLREGILPPMSGEYNNEEWKHSNGAWIRTEIWACLYPAQPEQAIRLAFEDACVDHGFGECSYAAIFIAAMESAAFVVRDAEELLKIGLSKIPEDCRVANSARLVMDAYRKGVPWQEARESLVRDSEDLGWFRAPANIGFVVLGLLYGEGDFKRSLCCAVNCGDDTDCTGATLGSILGIMGGPGCIPEDWRRYVSDSIKSVCLTYGHGRFPETLTMLTDCIMNLLPTTLRKRHEGLLYGIPPAVALADQSAYTQADAETFHGRQFVDALSARTPYSYVIEGLYADVTVAFDSQPQIAPGGTLTGSITLRAHTLPEQKHYRLLFHCPPGWQAECTGHLFTPAHRSVDFRHASAPFTLKAGPAVDAVNLLILEVQATGRLMPILVPVRVLG